VDGSKKCVKLKKYISNFVFTHLVLTLALKCTSGSIAMCKTLDKNILCYKFTQLVLSFEHLDVTIEVKNVWNVKWNSMLFYSYS